MATYRAPVIGSKSDKKKKLNPATARIQHLLQMLQLQWQLRVCTVLSAHLSTWKTLWDLTHFPGLFKFLSMLRMHATCFSTSSSSHIWVENIVTNIHIWLPGICRGSKDKTIFVSECKQYLLTENLSVEGLGRIFWIADIPLSSSPPILPELCPPKSQALSVNALQASC